MNEYYSFVFNGNSFNLCINPDDPSGRGCVTEIVERNEYLLDRFVNIRASMIDIGANCGVATIILAKQNPESTIYSFEPYAPTFELLKENVRINNLSNVHIFNKAVSRRSTKMLELCVHPSWSGGNTTYSNSTVFSAYFQASTQACAVECTSLDGIVQQFGIDEVALLKIDCEGAEYDILYDSDFFRQNRVRNVVGEFHDLRYNTGVVTNSRALLEYCRPRVAELLHITTLNL